ncbi:hypothetical protein GQ457_10G005490 [Hibiscus cannabinus]
MENRSFSQGVSQCSLVICLLKFIGGFLRSYFKDLVVYWMFSFLENPICLVRILGFVHFPSLREAEMALFMFGGAWVVDRRIQVNIAKFGCRSTYWRKKQPKDV